MNSPIDELKVSYTKEKGWRVDRGDKYYDRLAWEEMLAQVIGLTIPHIGDFWGMCTESEWVERERKFQADLARLKTERGSRLADNDLPRSEVANLRNEVNCRIEHGANSGGHLEYVQSILDKILKGKSHE